MKMILLTFPHHCELKTTNDAHKNCLSPPELISETAFQVGRRNEGMKEGIVNSSTDLKRDEILPCSMAKNK